MESYKAFRVQIRISHADQEVVDVAAYELAAVTATRLGMDGASIMPTRGLWRQLIEPGATIEIVAKALPTEEQMTAIRNHVCAMGLTAYITIDTVEAYEAY